MAQFGAIIGLHLFLGYHNITPCMKVHIVMSTHVLIDNALVQQKMAKKSLMVLCRQNPEYRCTGPVYRLHSHASAFAHSAFIMALGCLKKGEDEEEGVEQFKELVQKSILAIFRLAT